MKSFVRQLAIVILVLTLSAPAFAAEPGEIMLTLRAAQKLTDQQFQDVASMLAVVGATSEVQSLDWETMEPLLATLQGYIPPSTVWYAMPDGTYYTVDKGLIDVTLADRDYFPALMSGEMVIGPVVESKSSSELSAIIAVPIMSGDEIVGALGVSLYIDALADYLRESLGWAKGLRVKIVDSSKKEVAVIGLATDGLEGEFGMELTSAITGWTYLPLVSE